VDLPGDLTDLGSGFRDDDQLRRVRAVIHDRLADDRAQQECRYLMRLWWQLGMPYREVTLNELRAQVAEPKLAAVESLIECIRSSPEHIDGWIEVTERDHPLLDDPGAEPR
jgi:hypothetical protein